METAPNTAPAPLANETPAADVKTPSPEGQQQKPFKDPKKEYHKFRAGGQEYEVPYEELVRKAELGVGAEKRLAEATRKEKELFGLLNNLKTTDDLSDVIELLGGEARARPLLERFIWSKIQKEDEEAKLSPTELNALRRAEKAEREAAEQRRALEKLNESAEQQSKAVVSSKAAELVNQEISAAIDVAEKEGLSPDDVPYMLEQLIESQLVYLEYLQDCEDAGVEPTRAPLSPTDVLRKIREKDSSRTRAVLARMSPKELRALLSEEQLDGLRRGDVLQLTEPTRENRAAAKPKKNEPTDHLGKTRAPQKKPNMNDWFKGREEYYRQQTKR